MGLCSKMKSIYSEKLIKKIRDDKVLEITKKKQLNRRDVIFGTFIFFSAKSLKINNSYASYGASADEGYSLLLPSKWNPSKEKDFPGIVLRYEDNADAVNNLIVIKRKIDKSRIEELGSPTEFLNLICLVSSHMPGKQFLKVGLHLIGYLLHQYWM